MPTNITRTPSIDESDFTNNDYTVGWICALEAELAASQAMLDEEHNIIRTFYRPLSVLAYMRTIQIRIV